ncbi:hypothetical protein KR044_011516, partial [Drosophila immigrans]
MASRKMRTAALALFYVVLWVGMTSVSVQGKRYMRCELARKLLEQHSFERSLLSNWICLLQNESDFETDKITSTPNGSRYGLFQISSRYCQDGRRGGVCNVKCQDLLEENLREAAACAKRIQAEEGFRHWSGWQRSCRNTQNLPNLKVI